MVPNHHAQVKDTRTHVAMLERLDVVYSWAKDNKHQPFYNKVFGSLVSGGGDEFQHIHGVLYSAASNFGLLL